MYNLMLKAIKFLLGIIMIATIASCDNTRNSTDTSFTPVTGWILVMNGSVSDVEAAIVDYDGLAREVRPGVFRVELHPQSNGAVAVILPDGLPAYDLANMTGWLSAPPNQQDVYDAAAWITAPGDGIKYYLKPETSNPSGDTLIGSSTLGQSIRVFLPETGISKTSKPQAYIDEPEFETSPNPVTLEITLDTDTSFGNPRFVINSPLDHDWIQSWRDSE